MATLPPEAPVPEATPANEEEKDLLVWTSLQRPHQTYNREFYSTITVLAILVGIIFFFIEGIMPVLVIAAILFAVVISSRTPPTETEHKITTHGVITGGDRFVYDELLMFWVTPQNGHQVVNLITTRRLPRQLILVLPADNPAVTPDKVKQALLKYVPLQQLPPSTLDKIVNWLGRKLPLQG